MVETGGIKIWSMRSEPITKSALIDFGFTKRKCVKCDSFKKRHISVFIYPDGDIIVNVYIGLKQSIPFDNIKFIHQLQELYFKLY